MLLLGQFIGGGTLASVLEYSAKINISSALGLFLGVVWGWWCPGPAWCLHGPRFSRFGRDWCEGGSWGDSVVTSFAGLCSLALKSSGAAGIVLWVPAVSLTVFEQSISFQRESQDRLLEWLWERKEWDRMSRHMGWEVVHGCVGVCNTAISFQGLPL